MKYEIKCLKKSKNIKNIITFITSLHSQTNEKILLWDCWTLIEHKLNTLLNYKITFIHTCHNVKQEVHIRWPHGSIFTSLSFSAQILHSWNVDPISQYNSYCSWKDRKKREKKKDEKDNIQNLTYSLPKCASVTNLGDLNVVLWGGFTQACEIWVITAAVWKQIATDGEKSSRKRTRLRDLSSCATGSVASPLAVLWKWATSPAHPITANVWTAALTAEIKPLDWGNQMRERETSRQNGFCKNCKLHKLQGFFLHFLGRKEFSRIVLNMKIC